MSQPSNPGAVIVDSNVLVSICSKETTHPTAQQALNDYTAKGWAFYAPGVVVAEALFVLCRKLSEGTLTTFDYDKAIVLPKRHLAVILPPPNGDGALTQRAKEIPQRLQLPSFRRLSYLALTEEFVKSGPAEFLTFDKRVLNVAAKNAPTVKVNLLPS